MNPSDITTAILALGTGLGAIVFGYQKFAVANSKKDTAVANEIAQAAQYELLQEAIVANRIELKGMRSEVIELRAAFVIMDRKLHTQQRTITRMEMLLRQFSGLVSSQDMEVPNYMQSELEALLKNDD